MNKRDLLYYLMITIISILFMGRLIGLPVYFVLVNGRSMEPSMRTGDIALVVKGEYDVGDIVVWYSNPLYAVIHRVIEIGDDYIITKGDANPVNDKPISRGMVRGVVKYILPREIWFTGIGALILGYIFLRRETILKTLRGMGVEEGATLILSIYLLISIIFIGLTPLSDIGVYEYNIPSIHLSSIYFSGGYINIIYLNDGLWIRTTTNIVIDYDGETYYPRLIYLNGSRIIIEAPRELLYRVNMDGYGGFTLRIEALLSRGGILEGIYRVPVYFKDLNISIADGLVRIHNPNPVDIELNITIRYASSPGEGWRAYNDTILLPGGDELILDLSSYQYAYIEVEYILNGGAIRVVKGVMRGGEPVS